MSQLKPIVLYGHGPTPNPIKVAYLLEELGLPYKVVSQDMSTLKQEPFISLNPNGRLPALEDPNTGIKIFESGPILEYLVEKYDKENKFHYTEEQQKWSEKAWLAFQISGQGPYFGQLAWFKNYHPEKGLTSVENRYENEIKRVIGVVDAHLKKHGTAYLIGDKISYADIAFIPWFRSALFWLLPEAGLKEEYPVFGKWFDSLAGREAIKKVDAAPEFQRH